MNHEILGEGGPVSIWSFLGAMIFLLPGISFSAASGPATPDTPAGQALVAWLNAFNSGDRATFEAFKRAHAPWMNTDDEMARRDHSGGFDLLSIGKSGKLWITFNAREKTGSAPLSGALVVKPDSAGVISLLKLNYAEPELDVITLTAQQRDQVIAGAAEKLTRFYLSPEHAQKMAASLRTGITRGDFQDVTDANVLAALLTDELRDFSHDKHILVDFSEDVLPADPTGAPDENPDTDTELKERLKAHNCGFEKAEHLEPNIGYLKMNQFAEPALCAPTAMAAMAFLIDSDALIIDLRDNHGGAPRMVALIASYLFDRPTHLGDYYDRQKNTTQQSWTFPYLPGSKFVGKPVFVLTSKRTFSAAEEFSYDLKTLKRAIVIGETTGGGAHIVSPHRLGDHFFILIPFGTYISPITGTDWEGTGVEPDIKVAGADALDEALKRAREQAANPDSAR